MRISPRPQPTAGTLLALALALPAAAEAQSATVLVGRFRTLGPSDTDGFAAAAVRVDHAVSRRLPWLLAETGIDHAAVEQRRVDRPRTASRARLVNRYATPRRSVDLQLQVQVPGRYVRPFVGAGLGVLTVRALPDSAGTRAWRVGASRSVAAGLRLNLARHVGMRAELRGVRDRPALGSGAWSLQPTLGAAWHW